MSRITKDNGFDYEVDLYDMSNAVNKLGEIEDLIEKHKIENVEKLEEVLNFYEELSKYKAIENADSSKVLECLFRIGHNHRMDYISGKHKEDYNTIEQYILKSQEQEKENNKYKKLEEEIGCPLDVFVKLHNIANIYDKDGKQHKIKKVQGDVVIVDSETIYFSLSEYKKCFWLKEDRSE